MNESVYKNYSTTSSSTIVVANCLINIPLMLAAIIGNSLVLAAILTSPSLRSRASMILLAGLAVSDLAVGLITQPFYIAQELSLNGLIAKLSYTMSSSWLFNVTCLTMLWSQRLELSSSWFLFGFFTSLCRVLDYSSTRFLNTPLTFYLGLITQLR